LKIKKARFAGLFLFSGNSAFKSMPVAPAGIGAF
jgi:hypothetical protein